MNWPADLDGRRVLHEGQNAGEPHQLAAHAVNKLVDRLAALGARLQGDEEDAGVAGLAEPAARSRHHGIDGRLLQQDPVQLLLMLLHGVEGNILSRHRKAKQLAAS